MFILITWWNDTILDILSEIKYIVNFTCLFLNVVLESNLDCKDIKPVHPKGNQSWIFTGRTDVEAVASIPWPPDVKNWLIGKDPDAGKDWRQEDKGTTEDEMVGQYHQSMDMSLSKLQELVMDREARRAGVHEVWKSRTRLSNWTELNWITNQNLTVS